MLPPARTLKRLAAPLLVFILGIELPFYFETAPGGLTIKLFETRTRFIWGSIGPPSKPQQQNLNEAKSWLNFFLWGQHHYHLSAFKLGKLLDYTMLS